MNKEKIPHFINPAKAPKIVQMKGLETVILTGLQREKMMMVLNVTLPGHTVPLHSHPHEQTGMVYGGKAKLKIGDEERMVEKEISTVFQQMFCIAILPQAVNLS